MDQPPESLEEFYRRQLELHASHLENMAAAADRHEQHAACAVALRASARILRAALARGEILAAQDGQGSEPASRG